jgi:hypothetical protein
MRLICNFIYAALQGAENTRVSEAHLDAHAKHTAPHAHHARASTIMKIDLRRATMTKIKALSAIQAIEMLHQKHGARAVEDIKAVMSPEARHAIYETTLVPTDWIDVKHVTENLIVYDNLFGKSDGVEARQLVRDVATAQISGVYRLLFALTSPRALIETSARLWQRYYDRGESIATMLSANSASFRIVGCPDMPKHHEWMVLPSTEVALSHTGAKEVTSTHTICVADGADACVSEFHWR